MLETNASLLPEGPEGSGLRVIGVGDNKDSLDELDRLLTTLGVEPVGRTVYTLRRINPGTYVGQGKLAEIKAQAEELKASGIIFDVELSPNQLRNIEKIIGIRVIDRPGVIIEIFSRHARTKESKTQVELARLQYLYPRLAHFWAHFERQRGGGVTSRGMGETQIEVDRRLVKDRMALLRKRLKEVENERHIQRSGRKDVLKVAIVGYTNAGKSTLINALTHSKVLAEDKLFATLDPSVRMLDPNSHPPVVVVDTVGFISNLPTALVASFRSTLEELHEADLLLHVVDASSSQAKEQCEVTEEVLKELGVDEKERITVLNKADLLKTVAAKNTAKMARPGSVMVSAFDPKDMIKLRDLILNHFRVQLELWEVVLPYAESKLESQIHAHGSVETTRHLEKGTFYRVRIAASWAKKLGLDKFRT